MLDNPKKHILFILGFIAVALVIIIVAANFMK
jgi:hypothetical protein